MRILALSGSLRRASSNTALLHAAALLATPDVEINVYEHLGLLPHFNPDLDVDRLPLIVEELRHRVGMADALLISSPEYAHGIAGSMKNALDWLVSDIRFAGKPVASLNASPRASHAQDAIVEVLRTMAAHVVDAGPALPVSGRSLDAVGIAADDHLAASIKSVLARLADAARSPPAPPL